MVTIYLYYLFILYNTHMAILFQIIYLLVFYPSFMYTISYHYLSFIYLISYNSDNSNIFFLFIELRDMIFYYFIIFMVFYLFMIFVLMGILIWLSFLYIIKVANHNAILV